MWFPFSLTDEMHKMIIENTPESLERYPGKTRSLQFISLSTEMLEFSTKIFYRP